MSDELNEDWRSVAASNRERIRALEHELERLRDAFHEIRAEVTAIRYLAESVAELAGDVRNLARRVEKVAAQAVHRPTATGVALLGQYAALAVSMVALLVAVTR